jgi:predicted porin
VDNYQSSNPRYHQFNLFGDYKLSKRTVVYASAAYQRAAGGAQFAARVEMVQKL